MSVVCKQPVEGCETKNPARIAPGGVLVFRGQRNTLSPVSLEDQTPACAASAASSSKATMLVILIIGLTAGPAVSL